MRNSSLQLGPTFGIPRSDTSLVINSLKLSFTFLQSDILCRVIIPADSPLRVGTHLEFERLMPEGANFAHGTLQWSFWLPAHIIRLVKASVFTNNYISLTLTAIRVFIFPIFTVLVVVAHPSLKVFQ